MRKQSAKARRNGRASILALMVAGAAAVVLVAPGSALAAARPSAFALSGSVHVDKGNASCSDTGSGTASVPFCTISAAVAKSGPGATVIVEPGTYAEKINVSRSGTSGSPLVIRPATGKVVKIASPAYGFTVTGQSWVTIQGFKILNPVGYGVILSDSAHIIIDGNTVTGAGKHVAGSTKYGILVKNTTASTISGNQTDHNSDAGIALTLSSTNDLITGNTTFANARGYERAAPGIDVRASGNTISNNTTYNNEDTGIQLYNGASNNLVVNNISYGNGDHGIDLLNAPSNSMVSNTIYGNLVSGVTIETGSTGTTLRNNVVTDNGTTRRGNLWADAMSASGTTLDYDIAFQSGAGTNFTWSNTKYATAGAFSGATGNESHGIVGDPKFVNAGSGNFHLMSGSPAIDSADSGAAGEQSTDRDGSSRVDDPGTSNTGAGPRAYDDRGALEYTASVVDLPPVPVLTVTPDSGLTPLQVTADASGSTDVDATPIASYTFDFGDGTVVGPQAGSSAQHTYTSAGTWTVTVTVTDTAANHASTSKQVTTTTEEYVTNSGFESNLAGWRHTGKVSRLTRSNKTAHTGNRSARLANPTTRQISCGITDSPKSVATTAAGTYTGSMWVRSAVAGKVIRLKLIETNGSSVVGSKSGRITLSTSWQQVSVNYSPSQPGTSSIGLVASIKSAPKGVCFYADDISIQRH